jgi:O-antigen ligase
MSGISLDLILAILIGLGPYFLVAFSLAFFLALFMPWGLANAPRWFFFYIIPLCLFVPGSSSASGDGSTYKQITWAALYVMTLAVLYRTRHEDPEIPRFRLPWELTGLFTYVLMSALWSPTPATTLKRYILLAGLLVITVLASRLAIRTGSLARTLSPALAVFMLLGGLVALAFPRYAFDDGALRGFASHKNSWGQFVAICTLVFAHQVLTGVKRGRYLLLGTIAFAMVVLSKSSTSLLTATFGVVLLLFHAVNHKSVFGRLLLLAGGAVVAIGSLVFTIAQGELPFEAAIDLVYKLTERSSTLTGRTQLWMLMGQEIAQHRWLGLGYGAFWTGLEGPSGRIAHRVDWGPPSQAHSGYLDLVNELGLVGAAVMAVVVLVHLWRCIGLYRHGQVDQAAFHTTLIITFLLHNYAETTLMNGTSFSFIIVMCSIVEVSRRHAMLREQAAATRRRRLQARSVAEPPPDTHRLQAT